MADMIYDLIDRNKDGGGISNEELVRYLEEKSRRVNDEAVDAKKTTEKKEKKTKSIKNIKGRKNQRPSSPKNKKNKNGKNNNNKTASKSSPNNNKKKRQNNSKVANKNNDSTDKKIDKRANAKRKRVVAKEEQEKTEMYNRVMADMIFDLIDTNNDGGISNEELVRYLEEEGLISEEKEKNELL